MKILNNATERELRVTIQLMEDAYNLKCTKDLESLNRDDLINIIHDIYFRIK
tara:strand:+ start:69 stop:224 length:156 start_codon:yes stop_codon:yes gene_type:complete